MSNVVINEALLLAVLALTAYAVVTVDSEAWRGWYFQEILYRVPLDNWISYETAVGVDPVPIKAAITGVSTARSYHIPAFMMTQCTLSPHLGCSGR